MEAYDISRAEQGSCEVGEALITTAGELPARKVIHVVGPYLRSEKGRTAGSSPDQLLRE